eukprot:Nitzschia sp. Nitz4//scaffold396_size11502//5699//11254//NITZ4_009037-RA/size11502-snap-gene-0.7-mRNA-1//-1//CDS//3329550271//2594//frame0
MFQKATGCPGKASPSLLATGSYDSLCQVCDQVKPTGTPTIAATTLPLAKPTKSPKTGTSSPTSANSQLSSTKATKAPKAAPTFSPTTRPTPSESLSSAPTASPSMIPSGSPSMVHSNMPSRNPSHGPKSDTPTTVSASMFPSGTPTSFPSDIPSMDPSNAPSTSHSRTPSSSPSITASRSPSTMPSFEPSRYPSNVPSVRDSGAPTTNFVSMVPSNPPSTVPTTTPSVDLSNSPSAMASGSPSSTSEPKTPSSSPSIMPSTMPSADLSNTPTVSHSGTPTTTLTSMVPSSWPSDMPSTMPSADTSAPSTSHSGSPTSTSVASSSPSGTPSVTPSIIPTSKLSNAPSATHSAAPSSFPSPEPVSSPTIDPWFGLGSGVTVSLATSEGTSGQYGLVTGRTAGVAWHGIAQNVIDYVEPGTIYSVSFWARLANVAEGSTSTISLWMAEQQASDGTYSYVQLATSGTDGLTTTWQQFTGSYTVPEDGSVTLLRLYFQGDVNGWDFAVDELIMVDSTPEVEDYFVDASANTATVVIPQPSEPDLTVPRTNCPHLAAGLTDWNTLFPSPAAGQNITIPADTSVVVTSSVSTVLGYVMVPVTSELIFAENAGGITMDVHGIDVWGALVAGSETCRYETSLTITLHGDRPAGVTDLDNAMPEGIVIQGTLDFHGKRYFRTWTRLARRAHVGDNVLYLQDTVNWEVGQEIVLVTTAVRDSRDWHQNEVFTITSVVTDGISQPEVKAMVYIDGTVVHEHIARREYQAEVGLLTRTIKIQGSESDSPPTDTATETCATQRTDGASASIFGYSQIVCPDKYLTGYGGHVIIHDGGVSYVEGVELFRMGQTNVKARYPMHFHMLGDGCPDCYLKDSSIHESYYRCVSVHGTNGVTVTENVAYNASGFCYYLEDGVEEENILSFNLAAHIHVIGSPAIGTGQTVPVVTQSTDLTLPADIAASGFYITNMHNYIIGNVAAGGWAGFAFPIFITPTGPYRYDDFSPSTRVALEIDGNTAHSTANFWLHAAGFYFGGSLYYNDDGLQEYIAGRDQSRPRAFCEDNPDTGECESTFSVISNSRVYQAGNVGFGSWSGSMEVHGYESHDSGMAFETLAGGFWVDNMHVVCRTGETLALPLQRADFMQADGLYWYDTGQEHIMTNLYFKNCGFRSEALNQYDTSPTRGCENSAYNGCADDSTVFGFLTHSDSRNPEIMQATRNVTFDDVGRRFRHSVTSYETVSGRIQNWYDVDGSASGLNEPTFMGSGFSSAGLWWNVDANVVRDDQAPLYFVRKNDGPARGLAHVRFEWDDALHAIVDNSNCTNGAEYVNGERKLCNSVGHIRHLGSMFDSSNDPVGGLPITAMPEVVGLGGGFGWLMELDGGAPHTLRMEQLETTENTAVFLSIPYPLGTSFTVMAHGASWCYESCSNSCDEEFASVSTVEEVRASEGNVYHFDTTTGVLTFRVSMTPSASVGDPDWKLWNFNDLTSSGNYGLRRYERDGIRLPSSSYSYFEVIADCVQSGAYCAMNPPTTSAYDSVCSAGFVQESYDRCCLPDGSVCEYAYHPLTTEAPGATSAPTVVPANILTNGDFEESSKGVCPWSRIGSGTVSLETLDVRAGNGAALISDRGNTYTGILQYVTSRFQFDTTYTFGMSVKILSDSATAAFKVTFRIRYEDTTSVDYVTLYYRADTPSHSWEDITVDFSRASSALRAYPVMDLAVYFETPGHTDPFIVDEISMQIKDIIVV